MADGSVQLGGTVLNFFFLDPLLGAGPHLTSMAIKKHYFPVSASFEGWRGRGVVYRTIVSSSGRQSLSR